MAAEEEAGRVEGRVGSGMVLAPLLLPFLIVSLLLLLEQGVDGEVSASPTA